MLQFQIFYYLVSAPVVGEEYSAPLHRLHPRLCAGGRGGVEGEAAGQDPVVVGSTVHSVLLSGDTQAQQDTPYGRDRIIGDVSTDPCSFRLTVIGTTRHRVNSYFLHHNMRCIHNLNFLSSPVIP